jgi:hypothetical protein
MKYLIIQISRAPESDICEFSDRFVISSDHYQSVFVNKGIIDKLQAEINLHCGTCNSFVVPARSLLYLIHNPDELFDRNEMEEWDDDFDEMYSSTFSLLKELSEEITATDEEWKEYFETGSPDLAPLYLESDGSILIPEWACKPLRLKYEEVVFTFGTCKFCSRLYKAASSDTVISNQYKENNKMAMTVEIKGNKLCIEIDLEKPTPSSSGKTLVVASSRGNAVTTAMVDGKPVTIGLNAYIKP